MSDMKCPFCGKDMEITMFARGREFVSCNNPHCIISDWGGCSKQIICELIRTRKALKIAVKRLGYIKDNYKSWTPDRDAQMIAQAANGLDEIETALEQKD